MTSDLLTSNPRQSNLPVGRGRYRLAHICWRLTTWIVILTQLFLPYSGRLSAAVLPSANIDNAPSTTTDESHSKAAVIRNRTVPRSTPAPLFSEVPTDQEIERAHAFSVPLRPVAGRTSAAENRGLAQALLTFMKRSRTDDFSALTAFLEAHPDSAWKASLMFNVGKLYRYTGYISRALALWEETWKRTKDVPGPDAKAIADNTAAELAELYARLGRAQEITGLLKELEGREIIGRPATRLVQVREGLSIMKHHPEEGFMCGPYALANICALNPGKEALLPMPKDAVSTTNGTSLAQLKGWSDQVGMHMQLAKRTPGSELLVPSVVNWKAGHFAALLRKDGNRVLMNDPTFEQEMWISQQAVDDEGSGYFLVPDGQLPTGWTSIGLDEARTVWGKGKDGNGPKTNQRPRDKNGCDEKKGSKPMAQYVIKAMLSSLVVFDSPLRYQPPRGPAIEFTVTYDQYDVNDLSTDYGGNMGPNVTHSYYSYLEQPSGATAVTLYVRGGGAETYGAFNTNTWMSAMQADSKAILYYPPGTTNAPIRYLPDGSREVFGTNFTEDTTLYYLMTQITDPQSNSVSLTYDNQARLVAITDAIGQASTLSYTNTNFLASITDHFGRSAEFQYNTNGQLSQITDEIGIVSQFAYGSSSVLSMSSMTTPYGTTTFAATQTIDSGGLGIINETLLATDPEGGQEMTEFEGDVSPTSAIEPAPTNSSFLSLNGLMEYRNTFYWDKNAMKLAPGAPTQAYIYHWMHGTNGTSSSLESEKAPLEARVWYNYPGQNIPGTTANTTNFSPSAVARVMDDGSTQLYQYEYTNAFGKLTKAVDPVGRTTLYSYATNGIDLVQVRQVTPTNNDILATLTYNSQHLPLSVVDASGQTNFFGYNSYGQLMAVTNALGQTVTLSYNSSGYLTNILGSIAGATNGFTYDTYGRVQTSTDANGYTLSYLYDNLDRITKINHPDGTYEQIIYQYLEPILMRDRRGHWMSINYDSLQRVKDIRDSLNRVTHFEWCGCGSLESITDPLGNVTTWLRDVEGRPTAKVYPDNSQIQYSYGTNSGRLVAVTDAMNQTKLYSYLADDNLSQVSYSNPVVTTAPVSFTYDANYNRTLTMLDGTGTTTYSYNRVTVPPTLGAAELASVTGPLGNSTVTYQYDALGRATNRAINGVALQTTFDALGRVTTITNALGVFSNTYVGATLRLSSASYPNGQGVSLNYFGNTNDFRVQTILNTNSSNNVISRFDYTYDADGQIQTWTRQADTTSTNTFTFQYDPVDQLLGAVLAQTGVATNILSQYVYNYDKSGNRIAAQANSAVTGANYNNLNQLTNRVDDGFVQFTGNISTNGVVAVAGNSAVMTNGTNFAANVVTLQGTNQVQIAALDVNLNTSISNYQLIVTNNSVAMTLQYDPNGNLTNETTSSSTNTYEWDAENRLTAINEGTTNRSDFTYDGMGRRVAITEMNGGTVVSLKTFVWCGAELCEERDSTGSNVTKRFFGPGEQISGTNYFFTRDDLGSVREMTDASGTIHVRYDYDPYGVKTKISGDMDADFGFTGHYFHQMSGLCIAPYRAYIPNTGRWASRDPLAESAGVNLYAYVGNNPVNATDPSGLISSLNTPEGAAVMGWLASQMIAGGTLNGTMEATRQAARAAGGDCHAWDPAKIQRAFLGGAAMSLGLGGTMRAVAPAMKVAWGALASAFAGEEAPILGGAYRDIEAGLGEVHHMPADSVSTLSTGDGPAIWMETADHQMTASWGSSAEAQEYRAAQAELINQGKFSEALQMDINDIRSTFGSKYDVNIQQMMEYYNSIPPWMLELH